MSEYTITKDTNFDKLQTKTTANKKSHNIGIIKFVVVLLSLIAFAEFFVYLFILPMFSKPQIEFLDNKLLSNDELNAVIDSFAQSNWLGFSNAGVAQALSNVSAIETVSVHKRAPGHIAINIKERTPIAITTMQEIGRTVCVSIDTNGVVFKTSMLANANLPIISGLPIEVVDGKAKIPNTYRNLLTNIFDLYTLNPLCFAPISEICVVAKKHGNYELILHPVSSNIKVLLDRNIDQKVWQYMLVTLDIARSMKVPPDYIDLRYGSVSFRDDIEALD